MSSVRNCAVCLKLLEVPDVVLQLPNRCHHQRCFATLGCRECWRRNQIKRRDLLQQRENSEVSQKASIQKASHTSSNQGWNGPSVESSMMPDRPDPEQAKDNLSPLGRLKDWNIMEELGEGGSAVVYRAQRKTAASGEVAIKVVKKRSEFLVSDQHPRVSCRTYSSTLTRPGQSDVKCGCYEGWLIQI